MKQQAMQLDYQVKMAQIEADKEKIASQKMTDTLNFQAKYAELLMKREQIQAELEISRDENARAMVDQRMRQYDQAIRQMEIMMNAQMRMIEHHDKNNIVAVV
jgi:outer membrane murein-binding lipoprotein Lpp